MRKGALLRLPLMLWSFEEGLYGDLPAADVLRRLEPYVSDDNAEQLLWALPFYATMTDFLAAVGATRDRREAVTDSEVDAAVKALAS